MNQAIVLNASICQTLTVFRFEREISPGANYRPDLDGLRGIAILLVLGQHLFGNLFHFGFLGVDIFFVLSGYVIYNRYFSKPDFNLGYFYFRRFARLAPVVVVSLLAYLLVPNLRSSVTTEELLKVLLYIKNFDGFDWPLGPYWSLSAEEQFYLLAGLICINVRNFRLKSLVIRIGVVSLILISIMGILFGFHNSDFNTPEVFNLVVYRPSEILFGVIFASFQRNKGVRYLGLERLLQSPLFIGFLVIIVFLFKIPTVVSILTIAIICVSESSLEKFRFIGVFLPNRALGGLGVLSYSIYIWHPIVITIEGEMFNKYFDVVIKILSIFLVSVLSYRYLEMPAQRVAMRFYARLTRPG